MKKNLITVLVAGLLSITANAVFADDVSTSSTAANPIAQARMQIFVGNDVQARGILEAEITKGPDGDQKDLARLIYRTITDLRRLRTEAKFDAGPLASNGAAVQAEQAREKFELLANQGKRMDAIDAFKAFVAAYPQQVTPYDYYDAISAASAIKMTQAKALADFRADGLRQFPDDPVMQLADAVPLHWSGDAAEGVARMQKLEATAPEPLLSIVRARELIFLSGNGDNADRFDQAKKVAQEIFDAGQVDPSPAIQTISGMLESADHRDGGAQWLVQMAAQNKNPDIAKALRFAAVKEFIHVGEAGEANQQVATWKSAGVDAKELADLQNLVTAAVWTIDGTVPAAMLTGGTGWRVTAVSPPIFVTGGKLILDQSAPVGKGGSFSVPAPAPTLIGLLLSGHDSSGKFVVKELGSGVTAGHRGNARYPDDILLPPAPAPAEAPLAPNEFALTYNFGIGEDFSPQLVELTVPKPADYDPAKLVVKEDGTLAPGSPPTLPAQILGTDDKNVKVGVWRGLKQGENVRLHVLFDASAPPAAMPGKVSATPDNPGTVVDTGPAQFRIVSSGAVSDPAQSAPVLAVKGPDNVWHGSSDWTGDEKPTSITVTPGLTGPIRTSFLCHYEFSNGSRRDVTLSFDAGQPYVLIDEDGHGAMPGQWHWTLKAEEGFDLAFHACRPFHTTEPLVKRTPALGASLRDYCYFNGGNGDSLFIGATRKPNNPENLRDAVTVFEVHPGDWTNPGNTNDLPLDDAPDVQWEHPERYCGSRNTMISTLVTKDKEMPFTIPVTGGIRRWGIAVTDQKAPDPIDDRDPRAVWGLQRLLHTFGRGDLNRFLPMKLTWPVGPQGALRDMIQKRLPELASNIKTGLYAKAQGDMVDMANTVGGGNLSVLGYEKEDPAMVWLGWTDEFARQRNCAIGCLSIDTTQQGDKTVGCGDYLNMVGNREYGPALITYAISEDLGLITEAERQEFRRDSALLAYRYWDPDTMNYHANAGQPNFEADRLLQLSSFAAMFPDHPDSDAMAHNAAKYTAAMLKHWTIRDGGKWAENIGCYYLHSFNCTTMNVFNLDSLGLADEVTTSPYFEPFCRFGMNTLQCPIPEDTSWLHKDQVATDPGKLVRWVPGMGSHGGEGGTAVTLNFALMAQTVEKTQPKLAADMVALWQANGNFMGTSGAGEFGAYPIRFLLFGRADYPPEKLDLGPKRLPGWGMVMRDAVDTDKEFYLAFRAGTKAYRDVGNGSEFVMGALGRMLSVDGGDIGGPEQRTNLLIEGKPGVFWPVPMGPVTRWLISDAVEFARGEFRNTYTPPDPDYYTRDILFARNDYVLVHDEVHTPEVATRPGIFNFATPAVAVKPTPQGALCQGKLGVDLWITKLADEQPAVETQDYTYGNERTTLANQWKQIAVRVPIGPAGTVLLYPVKSGGAAPQIKKLADGVWQISGPGFSDVYFDQDGSTDGGTAGQIAFKGQMGLWRPEEEGHPASFSLLNGDSVTLSGQTLTAQAPATFELQGTSIKRTDGTAGPTPK